MGTAPLPLTSAASAGHCGVLVGVPVMLAVLEALPVADGVATVCVAVGDTLRDGVLEGRM